MMTTYLEEREARMHMDLESLRAELQGMYPAIAKTIPLTDEDVEKEKKITGLGDFEYDLLKGEDPVYAIISPELHEIFEENEDITAKEAICLLHEADALDLAIPATPAEVAAQEASDEAYLDATAEAFYGPTPEEAVAAEAELSERLLLIAQEEGPEAVEDLYRSRPDLY